MVKEKSKTKLNQEVPTSSITKELDKPSKAKETKEVTESIEKRLEKHLFTQEEFNEMQKELARNVAELRRKESEKASLVSQFGADIKRLDGDTDGLAYKINNGYEYRAMLCKVIYHWQDGTKDTVHPETGEIIETESITEEERQQNLPLK